MAEKDKKGIDMTKAATKKKTPTKKPELKTFKITAVIPTVQYGNLQPEYQVEAASYEEAHETAMPYMEKLWNQYCQQGSELKRRDVQTAEVKFDELTSELTGVTVLYNDNLHVYKDKEDGEEYMSGSRFTHKYTPEFRKEQILEMMQEKYGVPRKDISDMWRLKSEASTSLGTAIHAALEMYGKYKDAGEVLGANKKPAANNSLHDNPILKPIVESFYKGRDKESAMYEPFVADRSTRLCGKIDRLLIVDEKKKICRVQDFKTNFDVNKRGFKGKMLEPFEEMPETPLSGYWLQLSIYADILARHGWTVEGLDIFHFNGEKWETYSRKPIDFAAIEKKKDVKIISA